MKKQITILFMAITSALTANHVVVAQQTPEEAAAAAATAASAQTNLHGYDNVIRQLQELQPEWNDLPRSLPSALQKQLPQQIMPSDVATYPQLMVFLTLTMPEDALQGWMTETRKAGGVALIRGFHGGKLSTTLARIHEIGGDAGDLRIDPTAFTRLQIDAVPAVIVLAEPLPACETSGCIGDPVPATDRLKGNTSLSYALRRIVREGNIAPDIARHHLKLLDGGK